MTEALTENMIDELRHHMGGGSLWPRLETSANALVRRGFLRASGASRYTITPAGLAALAAHEGSEKETPK